MKKDFINLHSSLTIFIHPLTNFFTLIRFICSFWALQFLNFESGNLTVPQLFTFYKYHL
jgi:hypothetical protein